MRRSGLSVTLLLLFAVQLFGSMALASLRVDPCPDDTEGTSCPPICALCTSCTHAQSTIAQHAPTGTPIVATQSFVEPAPAAPSSQLADDIFHVPLPG
jgi:hypothetical protein